MDEKRNKNNQELYSRMLDIVSKFVTGSIDGLEERGDIAGTSEMQDINNRVGELLKESSTKSSGIGVISQAQVQELTKLFDTAVSTHNKYLPIGAKPVEIPTEFSTVLNFENEGSVSLHDIASKNNNVNSQNGSEVAESTANPGPAISSSAPEAPGIQDKILYPWTVAKETGTTDINGTIHAAVAEFNRQNNNAGYAYDLDTGLIKNADGQPMTNGQVADLNKIITNQVREDTSRATTASAEQKQAEFEKWMASETVRMQGEEKKFADWIGGMNETDKAAAIAYVEAQNAADYVNNTAEKKAEYERWISSQTPEQQAEAIKYVEWMNSGGSVSSTSNSEAPTQSVATAPNNLRDMQPEILAGAVEVASENEVNLSGSADSMQRQISIANAESSKDQMDGLSGTADSMQRQISIARANDSKDKMDSLSGSADSMEQQISGPTYSAPTVSMSDAIAEATSGSNSWTPARPDGLSGTADSMQRQISIARANDSKDKMDSLSGSADSMEQQISGPTYSAPTVSMSDAIAEATSGSNASTPTKRAGISGSADSMERQITGTTSTPSVSVPDRIDRSTNVSYDHTSDSPTAEFASVNTGSGRTVDLLGTTNSSQSSVRSGENQQMYEAVQKFNNDNGTDYEIEWRTNESDGTRIAWPVEADGSPVNESDMTDIFKINKSLGAVSSTDEPSAASIIQSEIDKALDSKDKTTTSQVPSGSSFDAPVATEPLSVPGTIDRTNNVSYDQTSESPPVEVASAEQPFIGPQLSDVATYNGDAINAEFSTAIQEAAAPSVDLTQQSIEQAVADAQLKVEQDAARAAEIAFQEWYAVPENAAYYEWQQKENAAAAAAAAYSNLEGDMTVSDLSAQEQSAIGNQASVAASDMTQGINDALAAYPVITPSAPSNTYTPTGGGSGTLGRM